MRSYSEKDNQYDMVKGTYSMSWQKEFSLSLKKMDLFLIIVKMCQACYVKRVMLLVIAKMSPNLS